MPEFPEVEAARQTLDEVVARSRVEKAGPAHVATLKTFDPPLAALEGLRLAGARRRGKNLLFPTEDGGLVLHVHLMSAGRIRFLEPGAKGPKSPAFRLAFESGGQLVLTEGGPKKRARVGVYRPDEIEAELAHLGPEADGIDAARLGEILRAEGRRLHPFLRDQRALAGIGRAWSNEILNRVRLSPFALTTELPDEDVERLATTIRDTLAEGLELRLQGAADAKAYRVHNRLDEPCPNCGTPVARVERLATTIRDTLAEGLELRLQGAADAKAYRVHNRLGEPCPNCGTPIARVDFEEHTIFYCPSCQTGGRVLKDRRLSRLLR